MGAKAPFGIFYNLAGKGARIIIRKPDKRTGKIYSQMQFKTLGAAKPRAPCLNIYHDLFYKDRKKIIPYAAALPPAVIC
jgi:hypothetical protein